MQRKKRTPNPIIENGKARMEKVRIAFQGNYTPATLQAFPELNNQKGLYLIENTWRGKSYYPELIEFWENMAGITADDEVD